MRHPSKLTTKPVFDLLIFHSYDFYELSIDDCHHVRHGLQFLGIRTT